MFITFDPQLISLYGSIGIHSYGFFIMLGISICSVLVRRDKRYLKMASPDMLSTLIGIGIIYGILGGKLVDIVTQPYTYTGIIDYVQIWKGGFSSLGSIIAVTLCTPLHLKKFNIPILPLCDLIAIYAPLMQAIARIGCLITGCCHGLPTQCFINVVYTHVNSMAPLFIPVHPTQLYSSIMLIIIFLYMIYKAQNITKKPGFLFFTYVTLVSCERFIIDIWRADASVMYGFLSLQQTIALFLILCSNMTRILLRI